MGLRERETISKEEKKGRKKGERRRKPLRETGSEDSLQEYIYIYIAGLRFRGGFDSTALSISGNYSRGEATKREKLRKRGPHTLNTRKHVPETGKRGSILGKYPQV